MFGNLSNFEGGLLEEFRRMQNEMDQLFGSTPWPGSIRAVERGTYPPINVGSSPEQVDVYLFAAGIDPKKLDISIQQNLLTVVGERRRNTEAGANYYRNERFDGSFRRVLSLPDDVDPDQVDAHYKDGVLHICIKRLEAAKPRHVEIH